MRKLNLIGERFGRLTVVSEIGKRKDQYYWDCICDCGNHKEAATVNLRAGQTRSCGCLRKGIHVKHGETDTRLYFVWQNMKHRCNLSNLNGFHRYGGRGITVCEEWLHDYGAFSLWAYSHDYDPDAPFSQCTLDRIDNDKGYSPDNCRWVTAKEQAANRRNGNQYFRSYNDDGSIRQTQRL